MGAVEEEAIPFYSWEVEGRREGGREKGRGRGRDIVHNIHMYIELHTNDYDALGINVCSIQ